MHRIAVFLFSIRDPNRKNMDLLSEDNGTILKFIQNKAHKKKLKW